MKEHKVLGGREKVTVAIAQIAPVFMDKERTIEKACQAILEAGSHGAELIVFPETFLAGYASLYTCGFETDPGEWHDYIRAFQDNAVLVGSSDTMSIGEAAGQANAHVVLGCNEISDRPGSPPSSIHCYILIAKDVLSGGTAN